MPAVRSGDPGGAGFTPGVTLALPNLSFPRSAHGGAVKSRFCSSLRRPSQAHPGPWPRGSRPSRRPSAAGSSKSAPGPRSLRRGPSPRAGGSLGDLQVRSFPPVKIASAARERLEKPQCWDSAGLCGVGAVFFFLPRSLFFLLKRRIRGGTSGRLTLKSAVTRLQIRRLKRLPAATLAAATKPCRNRLAQSPSPVSSGKAARRGLEAGGVSSSPWSCAQTHQPTGNAATGTNAAARARGG